MRFGSNFRHLFLAALFTACFAGSALAQVGRVGGIVRNDKGDPIRGHHHGRERRHRLELYRDDR